MENKFEYTYSAEKNIELEKIRNKYAPQTEVETKLDMIKKLDKNVEREATTSALVIGILGALILGIGMCCTMVWTNLFVLGIIVGLIGIALCSVSYPFYKSVLKKKRSEIAPQILKLTEELSENIAE